MLEEMDYHLELHEQEVGNEDDEVNGGASAAEQQKQVSLNPGRHERAEGASSSSRTMEPSSSSGRRQSSSGRSDGRHKGQDKSRDHGSSSSGKQQTAISAWRNILNMPSSRRRLTDGEKRAATAAVPGKRLGVSFMVGTPLPDEGC